MDFHRFCLIGVLLCNALSIVSAEFKFLALAARTLELQAHISVQSVRVLRVSFTCIPLGCVAAIPLSCHDFAHDDKPARQAGSVNRYEID